jgi:hypothetical protein
MPEIFTVGRGNPTEADIMRVLGDAKQGWRTEDLASVIKRDQFRVSRYLTELVKAGMAARYGGGSLSRWCSLENLAETKAAIDAVMSETSRRRLATKRLERKLRVIEKPRPQKPQKPLLPAFTIPPRGVPCSVWALGAQIGGAA